MLTTEVIENVDLIDDACALLYETYIEQAKWKFSPDNPSGIRIDIKNGKHLLVDNFTHQSRWFGVFDDDKLIGCARLTGLDANGRYEVEGYEASRVVHDFIPRSHCMEMGKVAVAKDYKGKRIINLIYLAAFEYCQRNKFSVFGCLSNTYIKSLFHRIKFNPKIEQAFRYEETDPTPVSLYLIDFKKSEFDAIVENLRKSVNYADSKNHISVLDALEIVAPILPVPVYWHDRNGHVLGINELCLKGMGITSEDVIGKTPYDFYPEAVADHILSHHELVMQTEQILSQEEFINNMSTGKPVYAKALKVPLYDDNGNVTGIIGTSIDITAEKEAERLERENHAQKSALEQQQKITLLARKIGHDINSPIATLKMMLPGLQELPANKLKLLRSTIDRLFNISKNLLDINEDNSLTENIEPQTVSSIYDLLCDLLNEKKIQFQNKSVMFELNADDDAQLAKVKIQPNQFKRAISNLLNNAVEALLDDKIGVISIGVEMTDDDIVVDLKDNGKGMNASQVEKILNPKGFTDGKTNGHGLGLQQVWDMIDLNVGKIAIHSVVGQGTTIKLSFPG